MSNPVCWLILRRFFGRLRRLGGKWDVISEMLKWERVGGSSCGLLPPAHLILSEKLDVVAAVCQFWVLLHRKYVVAIVALYSTCC